MIIALIALSLTSVNAETPSSPAGKLKCLNPVRVNPKSEPTKEPGLEKCLAMPDKPSKVKGKKSWK